MKIFEKVISFIIGCVVGIGLCVVGIGLYLVWFTANVNRTEILTNREKVKILTQENIELKQRLEIHNKTP